MDMKSPHNEVSTGHSSDQGGSSSRRLGLSGSFSMIAGSMLGVGIFIAPCLAAKHVHSDAYFLGLWIFTGLIALSGAFIYGKLGVMMPQSGGDYIFHREAFGRSVAFAYGWGMITAAFAGSLAVLSLALCKYQISEFMRFIFGDQLKGVGDALFVGVGGLGFSLSWVQVGAIILVMLITLINTYGLKVSSRVQELMTYIPLGALFLLCAYLLTLDPLPSASVVRSGELTLSGVTTAFLEVYFAYSGWNAVIYVAGEVRDPERTIPRALISGTLCVMALYLFFCASSLRFLGLEGISQHFLLGYGIVDQIGGPALSLGMTGLIMIALLASVNATVIGGGHVAYTMAKDRCFWGPASELSARHQTPVNALWILACIASLIIILVPYDTILSFISLVMVVGGTITAIAFCLIKRRRGDAITALEVVALTLFVGASVSVVGIKSYEAALGDAKAQLALTGVLVVLLALAGHLIYSRVLKSGDVSGETL